MTEEDGESLENFTSDYRNALEWRMDNVREVVTKDRDDADIIVQHPIREEAAEDADAEYIETMGLSVSAPTPTGTVTVQNTMSDTTVTDRFVSFDVSLIDEIIDALEEVKERYGGEGFTCPVCATEYDSPEELEVDEGGFYCPGCEYRL